MNSGTHTEQPTASEIYPQARLQGGALIPLALLPLTLGEQVLLPAFGGNGLKPVTIVSQVKSEMDDTTESMPATTRIARKKTITRCTSLGTERRRHAKTKSRGQSNLHPLKQSPKLHNLDRSGRIVAASAVLTSLWEGSMPTLVFACPSVQARNSICAASSGCRSQPLHVSSPKACAQQAGSTA